MKPMRMSVSLLVAAAVHGAALGGAALVASPSKALAPVTAPTREVDIDVVEARPDPVTPQPTAAVAPDEPSVPTSRPRERFAPTLAPAKSLPLDVPAPETPSLAPPSEAPELTRSNGAAAPAASAPAPSLAVAVPSSAVARGAPVAPAAPPRKAVSAIPRYRSNPAPDYPGPSRRRGEEGVVRLSVSVSAAGLPDSVSLAQSSGYPLLDRAAIAAVRQWTFEPARVGGVPVASQVVVPVRFSLSDP
ncbi:MAG TPA: TonB family protein [Polyangiaceae bacterium]|nr:TonB family protein [Polyangiaceae bacterium]